MIKVENVSMKFRMNQDNVNSLKEFAVAAAGRRLKYKDFWVFRDVSFEVKKGEVAGIIGRNGAGKSTLLKIISGILTPASGRVQLGGRVVPMLELGSGFDFELTGRENIFLNGAILGYSEQFLRDKYDEIVKFSELGAFIETPIRNYSSGMMMRLAFSIATMVQPEILIVDEILAVGDEAFQKKSRRKMLELMGGGTTVLFVSHSIGQIREMCDRVIWLENGRLKMQGETKYVCDKYQQFMNPASGEDDPKQKSSDAGRNLSDVLFIYGDDAGAYAWRVTAQREQLLAGAVPTNEIYYKDIRMEMVKLYRVFICVQCGDTKELRAFIRCAYKMHKKVLFDFGGCQDPENRKAADSHKQLYFKVREFCAGILVFGQAQAYQEMADRVLVNPPAAVERQLEYASWAVYDRDILPHLDTRDLSEDELINYNRAAALKRKREEDGGRIGVFPSVWKDRRHPQAENILLSVLEKNRRLRLAVYDEDDTQLPEALRLLPDRMIQFGGKKQEDLLRAYAQADVMFLLFSETESRDRMLQEWMQAALVKVPCFCMAADAGAVPQDLKHGETIWICTDPGQAEEQLQALLADDELLQKIGMAAYAHAQSEYSSVSTGSRLGIQIRDLMTPNLVFLVSDEAGSAARQSAPHQAAVMKQEGFDVTILTTGNCRQDMEYDGTRLPAVSRDLVYAYQYFDIVAAFDWDSAKWMQNYGNVGRRIYFVHGQEAERYQPGNIRRLEAVQMYLPHTPVQFACGSQACRDWLKDRYRQDALLIQEEDDAQIVNLYRRKLWERSIPYLKKQSER